MHFLHQKRGAILSKFCDLLRIFELYRLKIVRRVNHAAIESKISSSSFLPYQWPHFAPFRIVMGLSSNAAKQPSLLLRNIIHGMGTG